MESIFENCNHPVKAYWIGFIMADGCVVNQKKARKLIIELGEKDVELLKNFNTFVQGGVPIKFTKKGCVRLVLYSKKMVNDLEKYGIVPRKTGKEVIYNIPNEYLSHFIRGYFDGDGSIVTIHRRGLIEKRFSICCANKNFLERIQRIIQKRCKLSLTKIYHNLGRNIYYLCYGGNKMISRIFNYLYCDADIYLNRKRQGFFIEGVRWNG